MKMKNTKNKEKYLEIRDDCSNKTFNRIIGRKSWGNLPKSNATRKARRREKMEVN